MLYCFKVQVQCSSGLEPLPGTSWAGSGTRLGQVRLLQDCSLPSGMPPSPALCILNYDNLCDGFSPLEEVIISYSSYVVHCLVGIQ